MCVFPPLATGSSLTSGASVGGRLTKVLDFKERISSNGADPRLYGGDLAGIPLLHQDLHAPFSDANTLPTETSMYSMKPQSLKTRKAENTMSQPCSTFVGYLLGLLVLVFRCIPIVHGCPPRSVAGLPASARSLNIKPTQKPLRSTPRCRCPGPSTMSASRRTGRWSWAAAIMMLER